MAESLYIWRYGLIDASFLCSIKNIIIEIYFSVMFTANTAWGPHILIYLIILMFDYNIKEFSSIKLFIIFF